MYDQMTRSPTYTHAHARSREKGQAKKEWYGWSSGQDCLLLSISIFFRWSNLVSETYHLVLKPSKLIQIKSTNDYDYRI